MKNQSGCIYRKGGNWCLRWRENAIDDNTGEVTRKMRFKILAPISDEHKRNRNRIPTDIESLAQEFLEPVNKGSSSVSLMFTIGQLVDEYFENRKFKFSTREGYEKIWNRHLKARISSEIVRDFKRPNAFKLWKQIHSANPALTKRTLLHIRFFVSGIFEHAKNNGYYSGENPAKADIPQDLPMGKETEAYTVEEVAQILSLLTSLKSQAIIALLWGSGLRKGEAEGLDWRDYEETDTGATIHVRRSVWKGKISTPKNESSADVVHISSEIVEYIEAYRDFLGDVDEGFMFGTYDKPINLESFVRYELKPLMWAAGMTYKGLHGFRRGNATFLAKRVNGDGLKAASLVLRHSNEGVTRDHYIKNTKQERRANAARRVVEISETRKQAAVVLGAGLRQTAIQ